MNGLTPDITVAEVVRHGVLRLTFADGLNGRNDVPGTACAGLSLEDALNPRGICQDRN